MPHYHGATMGLGLVQGEIWHMHIFRIKVNFIISPEWEE